MITQKISKEVVAGGLIHVPMMRWLDTERTIDGRPLWRVGRYGEKVNGTPSERTKEFFPASINGGKIYGYIGNEPCGVEIITDLIKSL